MGTRRFIFTVSMLLFLIFASLLYLNSTLSLAFYDENSIDEYVGTIFMRAEFPDEEFLRIAVVASDISVPVLGVAFHLEYDSDNLAFLRYLPGDFLEKGGVPFYMMRALPEQRKIIFGETLKHDDKFPMGGGDLVYMDFQILGDDEWEFNFDRGIVSGPDPVRQDIDEVLWEDLWVVKSDFDEDLNQKGVGVESSPVDSGGSGGGIISFLPSIPIVYPMIFLVFAILFLYSLSRKKILKTFFTQ